MYTLGHFLIMFASLSIMAISVAFFAVHRVLRIEKRLDVLEEEINARLGLLGENQLRTRPIGKIGGSETSFLEDLQDVVKDVWSGGKT